MQIYVEQIAGVAVLSLTGNYDHRAQHELRQQMIGMIPDSPSPRVLVDLSDLQTVDSASLALLISLGRELSSRGGHLKLCAPKNSVEEFLRISRIDRAYPTYEDRNRALASF